ncbi:CvpA family protein [Roseiarcus sp.]|uniref:CvpA family protein n=1 Tax=Roseiarcus sp. TaxID=1969460 RepID=UPI003C5CFBD9
MPSYLDLAVIAIVLVSALLSMLRGFSREVLAIASWAAAAAAAYSFYPLVVPYLTPYIHKDIFAPAAAAAVVFVATLILVSLITVRLSDAILDSKIGALDRTLGFLFGVVRGFLLAVVAFAIFNWLVSEKQQPEWVRTAKTRPVLTDTADKIVAMLPEDAAATVDAWIKARSSVVPASEEPAEESSAPATTKPAVPPPAPAAPPQKKAESPASSGSTTDKQKLDALINKSVPAPGPATPAVVPKQ